MRHTSTSVPFHSTLAPPALERHVPKRVRTACTLLAVAACLALFAPPVRASVTYDAYAWPTSVAQGDTVDIYVSSQQPALQVRIIRYGATIQTYAVYNNVAVGIQPVPDSAYAKGCNWIVSLRVPIPAGWPSGVYAAQICPNDSPRYAPFVVREKHPGSSARMLYMLSLSTMHAYNFFGGKSLYTFNSTDSICSTVVSLRRPFAAEFGRSNFPDWGQKTIQFIESRGYRMEYCTSLDLEQDPTLPLRYGVVVSSGHDEYYSRNMRAGLAAHRARGGALLYFGANTCWWQIRWDRGERIICYKSALTDPMRGKVDSLVTVKWHEAPVLYPENSLTGASFRNGGHVNVGGFYMAQDGYGGFKVYHTNHWAFAGTHMGDGDTLGKAEAIVGYETDGALFRWANGEPVVTGGDGTPSNFVILGISPANRGTATMGCAEGPGLLFNAATTDWCDGLAADTLVQRITTNVLDKALTITTGLAVPQPRPVSATLAVRVRPNPSRGGVSIEWSGRQPAAGVHVSVFDLRGAVWAHPAARVSPGGMLAVWNGRDRDGRRAPPGVYFTLVEGTGRIGAGRFTLIR